MAADDDVVLGVALPLGHEDIDAVLPIKVRGFTSSCCAGLPTVFRADCASGGKLLLYLVHRVWLHRALRSTGVTHLVLRALGIQGAQECGPCVACIVVEVVLVVRNVCELFLYLVHRVGVHCMMRSAGVDNLVRWCL